ncbi:MAG TPA: phosphatidylserine/phosphatidylglycerophosphate/cardiolipin synthase family protein [Candidatus Paceibacterota bacterium]
MPKPDIAMQFDAKETWDSMLADCASARESIYLEQYIFVDDAVGQKFLTVLKEKAEQGLDVRVLLDMFGSAQLYLESRRIEEIRSWGVKLEFFNPIALWRLDNLFRWFSRRDHRKMLLVDERIAHIGSGGVGEYMNAWHEACVRLSGVALSSLAGSFNRLWLAHKPHKLGRKSYNVYLGQGLSYVASTPRVGRRVVHKQLLKAIKSARTNVVLVSPYFVPTERLMRSLSKALLRGVRVEIILPNECDSRVLDIASHTYTRSLAKRGAQVHLFHSMLHSKYFIVDGRWAMLGSANLDNMSLLNNYEHEIVGQNDVLVEELTQNFEQLKSRARKLDLHTDGASLRDRLWGLLVRPLHRFL